MERQFSLVSTYLWDFIAQLYVKVTNQASTLLRKPEERNVQMTNVLRKASSRARTLPVDSLCSATCFNKNLSAV